MSYPPDLSYHRLISTNNQTEKPFFHRNQRVVFDSSTIVDVPVSSLKQKMVGLRLEKSPAAAAEKEDNSDDEWIDGKDYPQFLHKDETWKTITASDMKRCIAGLFFENADGTVAEGARKIMPRVIPVSPPLTDKNLRNIREAWRGLTEAVAEGRAELRIVRHETLFTDCTCFSDEEDS